MSIFKDPKAFALEILSHNVDVRDRANTIATAKRMMFEAARCYERVPAAFFADAYEQIDIIIAESEREEA